MGIEESKTGRMPTDDEHAKMRRFCIEAMDAGACGWSAQRLIPGGPSAVQRDFDGSPMNTDVMHDETCLEMARVLGERGEGFQELTLASWDPKKDADHFEKIAEVSGRPIMYEALVTNDRFPHRHRNTMKWLETMPSEGSARSTARAPPPTPASPSPSRTGTCSTIPTHGAKQPPGPSPIAPRSSAILAAAPRSRRRCRARA